MVAMRALFRGSVRAPPHRAAYLLDGFNKGHRQVVVREFEHSKARRLAQQLRKRVRDPIPEAVA